MDDLALDSRAGLPDALRVLCADFPREGWQAHPHFSQMVQFWIERHLIFRKLADILIEDAQAFLDRSMDPDRYAGRLSRFGGILFGDLHAHHRIEDAHFFPRLRGLEPRIDTGFDLLESDHQAIDPMLELFAGDANAALAAWDDGAALIGAAGAVEARVQALKALLARHLEDEEDLIVPVILKSGGLPDFEQA